MSPLASPPLVFSLELEFDDAYDFGSVLEYEVGRRVDGFFIGPGERAVFFVGAGNLDQFAVFIIAVGQIDPGVSLGSYAVLNFSSAISPSRSVV